MKRLKQILGNIKVEIFIVICSVTLIPLAIAMVIMYERSVYAVKSQAVDIAENAIDYEIQVANNIFQTMEHRGNILAKNEGLLQICLDDSEWDYDEKARQFRAVHAVFEQDLKYLERVNLVPEHISYTLYINGRNMILDSKSTFYEADDPDKIAFLQDYKRSRNRWIASERVDDFNIRGDELSVKQNNAIVSKYFELKNDKEKTVGILSVNVSSSLFENYYNEIQKGLQGSTIIIDTDEEVVLSLDVAFAEQFRDTELFGEYDDTWSEVYLNEEEYLVISGYLDSIDAIIYILVSTKPILKTAKRLQTFAGVLITLSVFFSLLLTQFITGIFYYPIGVLKRSMELVEQGNLNVKIEETRKDDLQNVYNSFNSMTQRLENLVQAVAAEKLLKEEAELKLLQEQINPHFLYNALDSIYSIAKINKQEKIAKIVAALSRFFRVSLSNGKNIVTLKEALDIANSYLIIQNFRFGEKIGYSIEIEENLYAYMVPKLLFQPVVENAVYHGLERKKGDGYIVIRGYILENYILIEIEDNGVGIEPDKLVHIQEVLADAKEESNYYALQNLAKQLKILYRGEAKIQIDSEYMKGTKVTVQIPLNVELMNSKGY